MRSQRWSWCTLLVVCAGVLGLISVGCLPPATPSSADPNSGSPAAPQPSPTGDPNDGGGTTTDPNDGNGSADPNGSDPNGGGTTVAKSQSLTDFEEVWTDFSKNYSHFDIKLVDWDEIRLAYQDDFVTELSAAKFLARLAPMLAELEDLHVALFDAQGNVVPTYERPAERNYFDNYLAKHFPGGVSRLEGKYPLRHGWMDDNIAYLSIETFDMSAWAGLRTGEIDDLFQTYAGADGMIVDIRRNNGGAEVIGQAIAGHFTKSKLTYGYTEDRIPGDDRSAFADPVAHVLEPAATARFLKPVVLLMGQKNMSSAEWFILMMQGCPDVLSMGDESRGSSGNPKEFSLASGISYLIPSWNAYDADMFPIEDFGLSPDVWYEPEESYDDALERDYLLEDARDYLALLSLGP
ncbi:MAG: hypothetical protein JXQ73_09820 [Phycisphaerae bacterium]|nr:hypothetical protein [Phycisphaerae bacterium]